MKRLALLFALLACGLLAQSSATTPTKTALDQVKAAVAFNGVVVLVNGVFMVAELSPCVMIDTSGGKVIIRGVAVLPVPTEEEFTPTAGQVAFTLAGVPAPGTLEVFRNGVRMRVGRDFTAVAKVVTFTAQPVLSTDVIVVKYWPGN